MGGFAAQGAEFHVSTRHLGNVVRVDALFVCGWRVGGGSEVESDSRGGSAVDIRHAAAIFLAPGAAPGRPLARASLKYFKVSPSSYLAILNKEVCLQIMDLVERSYELCTSLRNSVFNQGYP